ncbi:hypothetical protein [Methanoculleus chikugoensis]|uniref:hypothetical protein n=1 Tax=Methanoculleus chikugoensis TaxID=118126 RepID=UPI000A66D6C0|nr:hypothetical protein [Methanoculleus chikugoensis]
MKGEPPQRRRDGDIPVEMGEFVCPFCGRHYPPTLEALHAHVRRRAPAPPPEVR